MWRVLFSKWWTQFRVEFDLNYFWKSLLKADFDRVLFSEIIYVENLVEKVKPIYKRRVKDIKKFIISNLDKKKHITKKS